MATAAEVATNTEQVRAAGAGAVRSAGAVAEEWRSVLLAVQWGSVRGTAWEEERHTSPCKDLVWAPSEAFVMQTLKGEVEVRLEEAEAGQTTIAGKSNLAATEVVQRQVEAVAEVREVQTMEEVEEEEDRLGVAEVPLTVVVVAEGRQKAVAAEEAPS